MTQFSLLEASRARADIIDPKTGKFLYPSYVEDIMGDIFSLGFGPFRWVCTSADPKDLALTDKVAGDVVERLAKDAKEQNKQQYEGKFEQPSESNSTDNLLWIRQANDHKLVVGSQARILYSDALGRATIAKEFNALVKEGKLKAPVVIRFAHRISSLTKLAVTTMMSQELTAPIAKPQTSQTAQCSRQIWPSRTSVV